MRNFLVSFISILLFMVVIDAFWLTTMYKRFYLPQIGHLLNDSPKLIPAVIFYLIFASCLSLLVILPAFNDQVSYQEVIIKGILLGLVTYATYDLTNQATLRQWPTLVTVVDLVWGGFLTGVVSFLSYCVLKYFNP